MLPIAIQKGGGLLMPKTSGKNKSSANDFARTAVIFSDLSGSVSFSRIPL